MVLVVSFFHLFVDFVLLSSEVLRLFNGSVTNSVLTLLNVELGSDFLLFVKEEVLGVRFRIQLCLKTTNNQLRIKQLTL